MGWLKLVPVSLIAAQAGTLRGAEDLATDVQRTGTVFSARARATLDAPAAVAWKVLTDYDGLPRFIPGLTESRVLARDANRVLVEQKGEARFLIFSYPIEVRFEVRESPFEWITSRGIAGNLRRMSGRYDLQAAGSRLQLRYTGEFEPDFDLPPLIGALAVRTMVEEQFTAMVDEIERRAAQAR